MKALATQFDNRRLSSAVATPTCSSCCCCCCCLATTIASSSLLAQRVNREAKVHNTSDRLGLTLLATLFLPVAGLLVYLIYHILNGILGDCVTHTSGNEVYGSTYTYQVCSNPANGLLLPLSVGSVVFVLWYLYKRVQVQNPLKRSILVTVLIAVAFTAEFFAGAALILTGVGGIVYLVMIPVIVGWISVWYHRHIGRAVAEETPMSTTANAPLPITAQTTEQDEGSAKVPEPPQPDPPATST